MKLKKYLLSKNYEIYDSVIVESNPYTDWPKEAFLNYWKGIKEEDIPLMQKAECHIIIYDDYIE